MGQERSRPDGAVVQDSIRRASFSSDIGDSDRCRAALSRITLR
jgi:hypothetical protein